MKHKLFLSLALAGVLSALGFAQIERPIVLKGLDPISLADGQEVAGKAEFSTTFGRFKYLFSSAENKAKFDGAPSSYGVQRNGKNLTVVTEVGEPDFFLVDDHKIYLVRNQGQLDSAKKDPKRYTDRFKDAKSIAILVFPGVQIIDYSGPYEVFGQAGYDVFLVSETGEPMRTTMGQNIIPDYKFAECPTPTVLLTPGGRVPSKAQPDNPNVAFVKQMSGMAKYTLSVCNGAFWLANAGLLDGKEATTFYGLVDALRDNFPKIKVTPETRFTDNGNIMTTSGLSSGIDGALRLVGKLDGEPAARSVAYNMEYNYQPNSDYSRAAFADKYLKRISDPWDVMTGTKVHNLNEEGDRNHWSQAWELINPKLSVEFLAAGLEKATAGRWTKVDTKDGVTTWSFKGDDGATWKVKSWFEHSAQMPAQFVAKFELSKA